MKRFLLLILSLITAMSLFACNGNKDGEENNDDKDDNTVTYTITVLDGETPVEGTDVYFMKVSDGKKEFAKTDANGKATLTAEKGVKYMANISDVEGMKNPKEFDKDNSLVVNVKKETGSNKVTYTVYVKDASGNPVVGATVQMCDENNMCTKAGSTDSDGKVVIEREEAAWEVQVDGINGKFPFDSNNTVTITKP